MRSIDHCFEEHGILQNCTWGEETQGRWNLYVFCKVHRAIPWKTRCCRIFVLHPHTLTFFQRHKTWSGKDSDSSDIDILMPSSLDIWNSSEGLADRNEHGNLPRLVLDLEKAQRPSIRLTAVLEVLKENGEERAMACADHAFTNHWKANVL